jgi:hypothetical protein
VDRNSLLDSLPIKSFYPAGFQIPHAPISMYFVFMSLLMETYLELIKIRYIIFILLLAGCKNSPQNTMTSTETKANVDSLSFQDSGYQDTKQTIAPEHRDIFNFLEFLKWTEDSDAERFDLNKTPKWDIVRLAGSVSDSGVLFIDPNDDFNKRIKKQEIEVQVRKRKGPAYEMISYMAYLYSIPYKQYSELKLAENDQGDVVVQIGSSHELTFETKGNKHYLTKCEYLQLEGE